jgi:predicted anti-sigma-YlaC factor YlaD
MTERDGRCEEVLASVLARLDGETAPLTADAIDKHLQGCPECRTSAAELGALHARLTQMELTGPQVNLWPAITARLESSAAQKRDRWAFALLAALCIAWRTGQLLLDLPAPALNAVVPLIVLLVLTRWLAGDPLTIALTTSEMRQERA